MRFDCYGELAERTQELRNREWHRYFCWLPTKIAFGDCRWLEWIERRTLRYEFDFSIMYHEGEWEYRELEDA